VKTFTKTKEFPLELAKAIPVGADLRLVWHRFAVWLLVDPEHGVIRFKDSKAIRDVAALHQRIVDGEEVSVKEWADAEEAAEAAASASASAAERAAFWAACADAAVESTSYWAACADAAERAAFWAECADASAAASAASMHADRYAAMHDAAIAARIAQKNKLIGLIKEVCA
jgi:hypothetical protein